jgi:hypothetical protein
MLFKIFAQQSKQWICGSLRLYPVGFWLYIFFALKENLIRPQTTNANYQAAASKTTYVVKTSFEENIAPI